ncbi:MAG: hypothetical protein RR313_06330 [Anaerovoracaceae bacterium]
MKIKIICLLLLICIIFTGCNTSAQNSEDQKSSASSSDLPLQNETKLNLRDPSDSMVFLETVLSEIEEEQKRKPNIFLDYSDEYTIEYIKNKERNFILFKVEDGPGIQTYIIVDADTKDYQYFNVSDSYRLLSFDDSNAKFICPSGQVVLHFPNFPYQMTYSFDEKKWNKEHLPINSDHAYFKLGGHPASFGVMDRIEVTANKAEIIFNFDEIMKNESMGSSLPILHYWFNPIANEATLSFSGVSFSDDAFASQLELLAGITNVKLTQTEAIDLEAKASGVASAMQITFNVSPEYNLYGEYDNVEWDSVPTENNDMSFWLWTEKK